jgi:hypothetical protein
MEFTENDLLNNWNEFISIIETNIEEPRKSALITMYGDFQSDLMFAPAASNENYHNCFVGGYIDHVIRVVKCSEKLYDAWGEMGASLEGFTKEELIFSAINHDLGKAGAPKEPYYIPNPSDWHRKNQGKLYKTNPNNPFTMVPDLSIWLLQEYGVKLSWNEYQAIKIHDGMYDESNKPYFVARSAQAKLKTNLPVILHHADHMASIIEYERWRNGKITAPATEKSKIQKSNALKNLSENNPDVATAISDIFSAFNVE